MKAGIYHLREGSTRSRKGKGEKESLLILFPECLVKLITCLQSKCDSTSERLPSLDCCTRLHLEDGSASVKRLALLCSCGKELVYIIIILLELTVQKLALIYRSFHCVWQRQGLVLATLTEQERLVESFSLSLLSPSLTSSLLTQFPFLQEHLYLDLPLKWININTYLIFFSLLNTMDVVEISFP